MLPDFFFFFLCRMSLTLCLCLLSAIKTSVCDLPGGNLGYSLPILQTTPSPQPPTTPHPQFIHNCFAQDLSHPCWLTDQGTGLPQCSLLGKSQVPQLIVIGTKQTDRCLIHTCAPLPGDKLLFGGKHLISKKLASGLSINSDL